MIITVQRHARIMPAAVSGYGYVPKQQFSCYVSAEDALTMGSLFPELSLTIDEYRKKYANSAEVRVMESNQLKSFKAIILRRMICFCISIRTLRTKEHFSFIRSLPKNRKTENRV